MDDAQILIRSVSSLTSRRTLGLDGLLPWPIDPAALLTLYTASAEHSRAIHVKAEGAFGGGFRGPGASLLERLCGTGSSDLFVQLGVDLECYGNAFIELVRTPQGKIVGLGWLPAITMARREGGGYRQTLRDGLQDKVTDFAQGDVLHLRPPCPGGGHYALPTWIGAVGMLELVQSAISYNQAFFANNAIPDTAIITHGPPLTSAQKDAVKTYFQSEFRGTGNAHRSLYLHFPGRKEEYGIEFRALSQGTKDGEFLKLLDAARDRIPVAHGVPPRMLGIATAGALGGTGEVSGQLFIFEKLTLAPRRRRMLDQLRALMRELGVDPADHHFAGIDLTPPGEDTAHLSEWVQAGILTADEARAILPFEPGAPQSSDSTSRNDQLTKSLIKALERL